MPQDFDLEVDIKYRLLRNDLSSEPDGQIRYVAVNILQWANIYTNCPRRKYRNFTAGICSIDTHAKHLPSFHSDITELKGPKVIKTNLFSLLEDD